MKLVKSATMAVACYNDAEVQHTVNEMIKAGGEPTVHDLTFSKPALGTSFEQAVMPTDMWEAPYAMSPACRAVSLTLYGAVYGPLQEVGTLNDADKTAAISVLMAVLSSYLPRSVVLDSEHGVQLLAGLCLGAVENYATLCRSGINHTEAIYAAMGITVSIWLQIVEGVKQPTEADIKAAAIWPENATFYVRTATTQSDLNHPFSSN